MEILGKLYSECKTVKGHPQDASLYGAGALADVRTN